MLLNCNKATSRSNVFIVVRKARNSPHKTIFCAASMRKLNKYMCKDVNFMETKVHVQVYNLTSIQLTSMALKAHEG